MSQNHAVHIPAQTSPAPRFTIKMRSQSLSAFLCLTRWVTVPKIFVLFFLPENARTWHFVGGTLDRKGTWKVRDCGLLFSGNVIWTELKLLAHHSCPPFAASNWYSSQTLVTVEVCLVVKRWLLDLFAKFQLTRLCPQQTFGDTKRQRSLSIKFWWEAARVTFTVQNWLIFVRNAFFCFTFASLDLTSNHRVAILETRRKTVWAGGWATLKVPVQWPDAQKSNTVEYFATFEKGAN